MSTFLSKNKTLFYLLSLYCQQKGNTFPQQQLASILKISSKQLNRYLKLFQQHNWITYKAGNGRGHLSKIQWHEDIEQIIVDTIRPHLSTITMMDWEELLTFPNLTDSLAVNFKHLYHQNIKNNILYNERLIAPIYHPIYNLQPNQVNDIYSAALLSNITNRLVETDTNGNIIPSLAHHWKINDMNLRLYLRKNVVFHNGDLLTAHDVAWCLRQLLHLPLWKPIREIIIVDMWTIDFILSESCTYVLHLLTDIKTSIYKVVDNVVFGTGPFAISKHTPNQIVLEAYDNYFGMRALLHTVELNILPKSSNSFYQTNFSNEITPKKINIQNGVCAIILNKNVEACSTKVQRQGIKNVIHKHLYKPLQDDSSLQNHLSSFSNAISQLSKKKVLKIGVPRGKVNLNQYLFSALTKYGYQPQLEALTLSQYIKDSLQPLKYDALVYTNVVTVNTAFHKLHDMFSPVSPIYKICKEDTYFINIFEKFKIATIAEWPLLFDSLNHYLIEEAILIPLFTYLDDIPFAHDILELNFNHLGYIDLSTIWYDKEEL
ncbi:MULTISPECIES: ABC transporter substrate-binding protein [unclassified Lysinibacillus]|uniref:ABC transporter substrate-binding protein n=1 Tax=unclassified Lysinibacillus TaxID=2636778 RepID=UPI002554F1E7|nr:MULTISPECIES: ABC transporter substrate-binding protein [unclassified Lysinibacillus]MDM5246051.1 ABC transporter substrate-binding protein [Lysinibacillus sp. G4S2]